MKGFNGTQQVIDIPAGTTIAILATGPVRRLTIDESQVTAAGAANAPSGILLYQIPNDGTAGGFSQIFAATAGNNDVPGDTNLPIQLGDDPGDHGPLGSILGNAAQTLGMGLPPTGATVLCRVSCPSAATSIQVRQDY